MFFFVLGLFYIRNQAIGVTKTTVDIIEICDAYFTAYGVYCTSNWWRLLDLKGGKFK